MDANTKRDLTEFGGSMAAYVALVHLSM